jgi:putative peptidoglycan lipid II flippase
VEIHSRGFYALGDTRTPVILTGVNLAVNAVLSAILWQEFELAGLAFAVGVASWVEWLVLYHLYARRAGANTTEETTYIGAYAFAGGAMAIFVALSWWLLEFDTGARATVGAVALCGAGAAFYFGLSTWLGLPEVREVAERGRALLRRDGSGEDPARTMLEALEE